MKRQLKRWYNDQIIFEADTKTQFAKHMATTNAALQNETETKQGEAK